MGASKEPRWVPATAVLAIQRELIVEHGGLAGPPRVAELEASLARPRHRYAYAEVKPTLAALAAANGCALARSHVFPDGNKRLALATMDVFLRLNGYRLTAEEVDAVAMITDLASGEASEDVLSDWIAEHSRKVRGSR